MVRTGGNSRSNCINFDDEVIIENSLREREECN